MPVFSPAITLPAGISISSATPTPSGVETLTYISGLTGQRITFGDTSLPTVYYKGITGHGLAPVENFVVDTAYQAGARFVRSKKKTSVITVTLTVFGDPNAADPRAALWNVLDQILGILEPSIHAAGTLIKTDTTGTSRQLFNCQYVGGFEVADKAENHAYLTLELLFEAYDPTWYSVTQTNAAVGSAVDAFGFTVPFAIPLLITGQATNTVAVINLGNVHAKPVITFTGPCGNPVLYNGTTGEGFSINYVLQQGDSLAVDCAQGAVTLTPSGLAPQPYYGVFGGKRQFLRLAPGTNVIQFSRDNPANNQCTVSFYHTWNHG